ncbi:MAG: YjfB family protein [Burkholderiales bacterium]|nr:YjfB family protein [Burkholderiales bacterium]
MGIANTTAVQSATAAAQAPASDSLNIRVLKKALDQQESNAQTLLDALPQTAPAPALATSGSLGTQLNTYA